MALKKNAEAPKAALNIEQIADLYLAYYNEKKEAEKKEKEMKEQLLAYAKENKSKFDDKTLKIGDTGVYIEKRTKLKSSFDEKALDMDWLDSFIDAGYGEFISIKFDDKAIAEYASEIIELNDIDYTLEYQEVLAVCTTK